MGEVSLSSKVRSGQSWAQVPLIVCCDSEVEVLGLGELSDAELHGSTKLLFFDLIGDQAPERIADGANERHGMCEIGPQVADQVQPAQVAHIADGSVLMIGPTHDGRLLTAVLNPDVLDSGAWHVRTAWPASTAQANRYHRDR